jgi:ABC-type bacteriocin/lantibiotic exporter with double-glycine peptidase domain
MSRAMSAAATAPRRWLATEVVQTSAMDCGPAALKCLLEGHGIPVNYGRLREACQTSLDGTSIDTLEGVATQLGLQSEQVLIPLDHVAMPQARALPAIAVVKQVDGAAHFVVVWRRVGSWLQLMDPATGRRWIRVRDLAPLAVHHRMSLPAADWRDWAASDENTAALLGRLQALGADPEAARALLDQAQRDSGWFALGALDAATRLVQTVVQAGGLPRGAQALQLLQTLFEHTIRDGDDVFRHIPPAYWSAQPDVQAEIDTVVEAGAEPPAQRLVVSGAVLLRVQGRVDAQAIEAARAAARHEGQPAITQALAAALQERQPHPMRSIWRLLRQDGLLGPVAMLGAMALAAGALVAETLLFRGLFDIAAQLGLGSQRLLALAALLAFAMLLLAIEWPIVMESLRYGRHLETRLRMALLAKLPRLNDRYFQSRSVSDMAERNHNIQMARNVPMLGLNFVQTLAELVLTLIGIALIAPDAAPWALALVAAAVLLPLLMQPLLNERDLRLRNHAAALNGFYLDALLGLVPVRTHRAQRAVRRQHEGLLVEWTRASRSMLAASVTAGSLQTAVYQGLAAALLVQHFRHTGSVSGGDLLLVYWALKLPSLGGAVGGLARQYPAQRNVLMRLFEPLTAPEEDIVEADVQPVAAPAPVAAQTNHALPAAPAIRSSRGISLHIEDGQVLAGGHTILRGVDLHIAAGEHVAIVGASGAGKSSLVGLFLGWHRLAQGRLRVDGVELEGAGQDLLRRQTAWVDPSVQLWNRSFLDNLMYAADEGALARVGRVITAARLTPVLQKLPQGLQTPLGEGGALLSGGEGQRVRLGRAMLQDGVRLALLDEPFRGLDREQRGAMLADARQWWADSTLLCVTHDVGETLQFPRVLVIDDGRIVEDGVPAELAAGDSHYARLLQAEGALRGPLWNGPAVPATAANDPDAHLAGWRHVRVEGGALASTVTAPHTPHARLA